MKLAMMRRSVGERGKLPTQELRVEIRGGYRPETVRGRAGVPVALVVRREDASSCGERLIVPALGRSVSLPLHEDVRVELGVLAPGEYEFTCEAGLLRGRLVLE